MAVTAPTPPTPPTPPSVPGVKLQDGGSVKESTIPQSGKKDHDTRVEQQAKQYVADGNGALSKTVVEDPAKQEAGQKQPTGAEAGGGTVRQQADVPARQEVDMSVFQEQESAASSRSMTVQAADIPESPSYHGPVYWFFSVVSVLALAVVLFRTFLRKKTDRIQPQISSSAQEEPLSSSGIKVGEALHMMQAKEAAKSYGAQSAEPRRDKPPAGSHVRKAAVKKASAPDEERHFEIRI